LADGKPVTIDADDTIEDVLETMSQNQVRRLPVIDGHRLVGIISEAHIARHAPIRASPTPSKRSPNKWPADRVPPAGKGPRPWSSPGD
jgi:CBS-domain-containing membrane protein